jgi:hypothetical protein
MKLLLELLPEDVCWIRHARNSTEPQARGGILPGTMTTESPDLQGKLLQAVEKLWADALSKDWGTMTPSPGKLVREGLSIARDAIQSVPVTTPKYQEAVLEALKAARDKQDAVGISDDGWKDEDGYITGGITSVYREVEKLLNAGPPHQTTPAPASPPAAGAAAGARGNSSAGWRLKDVVFGTIFLVVAVVFLGYSAVRTVDVYYKAAWIVRHFPPKGVLCCEPFCVRTETRKPERRFLALRFAYCDQHYSGGFQGRGSRSNAIAMYVALTVVVMSFASVPVVGALFRIAALPVLLLMCLAGKLPWARLLPFSPYWSTVGPEPGDGLESAGMWTGAILAVVALALYCWW